MIQPGTYRARCTGQNDAQWGMSQSGNAQLGLRFTFLDEGLAGQHISWVGTFAPGKATEFALNTLENCGWNGVDPTASLEGIELNEVLLVIEHEIGQDGKSWPRVKWVNKANSGRIKFKQPLHGQELKIVGRDIKAEVIARRQAQGRPVTSEKPTQQSHPVGGNQYAEADYDSRAGDDDIPF